MALRTDSRGMTSERVRERWILIATILGSSMVFIDGSVVTLALPQMQRTFGASSTGIAWVIEGYTLILGALMLFGGAVGDRIGRKRAFIIGTIVFALGSAGCAFAWSLTSMILARCVQGIGGMLLAPSSLALIGAHFTGEARGRAIAAWSAFSALTSTLGPALGGILIDHLGWRSVFWINIPLAIVVLYASFKHLDESRDESATGPLDLLGATLVTLGLGGVTYALISSSTTGWHDARTLASAVAGIVLLVSFFIVERHIPNPLLPIALFRSRTFTAINIATLLIYGAGGGNFYEMPFVMIQGHGYSATQAAISTLPVVVCIVLLSRVGTLLAQAIGRRAVLTIGPAIVAIGYALLGLLEPNESYWTSFFPGLFTVGIGMGLTVAPLTATVVDTADPRHMGAASGVNNAVSRIAGLLAIAVLSIVVWTRFNAELDHRLAVTHVTPAQTAAINAQRDRMGGAHLHSPAAQSIVIAAFRSAYRWAAFTCAALCLLAAIVDVMLIENEAPVPVLRARRAST